MDLGLKDKVAVVTGGADGIGAAVSRLLSAEGAIVLIADRNGHRAEITAEQLRSCGGKVDAETCDVTDEESVECLVNTASERYGGIDILVNNAGFTRDMRIVKMGLKDWDAVVDVVLKGAFLCTRAVIPHMEKRGAGRIINMSSRAHLGNAGQANYSAAKAGLIGFTKAMALEHGRNGITVNAVAPGIIGTDAVKQLPHYEKILTAAQKTTPIPRIGTPDDVASMVAFLASDLAGYVTGDVMHVTGGRY